MLQFKYISFASVLTTLIASAVIIDPSPTFAQSVAPESIGVTFPPKTDRGAPSRTRGSGSRGPSCKVKGAQENPLPLTAIMPKGNVGTTTSPNPQVYVYVPQTVAKEAELVLYDWENQVQTPVYETILTLPETAGIVQIALPQTVELQVGNTYSWYFGIICNPEQRSLDISVQGWLERVNLSQEQQTMMEQSNCPSVDKARLYAQAGVWQEALSIAADLRVNQPEFWSSLLNAVGLNALVEEQILD